MLTLNIKAQSITGTATYQSQRHIDLKLGDGIADAMQKQLQEQLKNQFQKTYNLNFNNTSSTYKVVDKLNTPSSSMGSGRIEIIGLSDEGNQIKYTNIKDNTYIEQTSISGKPFLIKDKLPIYKWKLENETKNIGQYTCYKATYTKEISIAHKTTFNQEPTKNSETKETQTVTAWYTLDIPVQHGPDGYTGLPGLILEVGDGKFSLMCTKVVLNPKKPIAINTPKKGKVVTKEKFEEILDKKTAELIERYSGGMKNGQSISIEIGG